MSHQSTSSSPSNAAKKEWARSNETPGAARLAGQDIGENFSEMKAEIERLTNIVAEVAAHRARQASDMAEQGIDAARQHVRAYPWTSVAVAGIAGALIAVATQSARQNEPNSWRQLRRSARRQLNDLKRFTPLVQVADVSSVLPNVRMPSIDVASKTRSLADGIERMVTALADFDPRAAKGPFVDAIQQVMKSLPTSRA